jgi:hypothetical protein
VIRHYGSQGGTLLTVCAATIAFASAGAVLAPFRARAQANNGTAPATAPAQAAPQATVAINYRERPRYPYDPQRLKRRPILDGTIADNEWDPLYTIGDAAAKGTVYVNWDDDFLYVAARTDQPCWLVFDLDANADGWLRGADNLEVSVAPVGAEGMAPVTARILDAAGNKDAPMWNDHVVDPRSIQIVQKGAGGSYVTEMAIPKGIAGLALRQGATLSCRADLTPSTTAPAATAPYEPHLLLDVNLVEARTIGVAGLTPRLVLEDNKVIPGQQLRATLELMNQSEGPLHVRSVTWRGNTGADDLLRAERDPNVPDVPGLKTLKRKYSSKLPDGAVPGFYQVTGSAELENGKTVQSTASFSVVDPYKLQIVPEPDPVNVLGPTVVKFFVEIFSAVPGSAHGDVEIEVPAGWEVKGKTRKAFYVQREDSAIREPFYVTLPSNTPAGDYTVNATVYWQKKSWKTRYTVKVNRSTAPEVAPKPDAKPVETKKNP